jgi:hypothetical protein
MRRWILLCVAIVGLSAIIPIALSNMPEAEPPGPVKFPVAEKARTNLGRALIEGERKFDFGNASTYTEGEREFTVKNVGTGDLTLRSGSSSCYCTVANFSNPDGTANKEASLVLKPGESSSIKVSWKTKDKPGKFAQRVSVLTSDPSQPEIDFAVTGMIYPPIVTMPDPPAFDLASVNNDEPTTVRLALASFDKSDFQVTEIIPSNASSVTAEVRPLNDAELSELRFPAGQRVDITVHPSADLGEFAEQVTFKTDHPQMPELATVVRGKRVGPISVAPERIRLNATSSRGGKMNLLLLVREQEATNFEIASKPDNLEVRIEPLDQPSADAKVRRYRLQVEVPPGTPAGATDPNQKVEVVLKTDHPKAQTIAIPVTLVVMSE